ncbi:hypothetical protein PN36_34170 [Candidatus Thiomargarita nelsonii]|uniref:CRISPR type III-associated protein domain-containing protein n=1 Tax=Candidatus Thiomargarita nelsonii TaxID=1003181 RepID=A0A0A6P890_9GAMM|nr:hypothetical protein PN36_34170 [Candidatus Thiomargarita nelsonii]
MTCFDLLADKDFKFTPTERGWLLAASRARKDVKSQTDLTEARNRFLQTHGIVNPVNKRGKAKHLPCRLIPQDLDTARRGKEVLESFPRYSARLLLEFTLLTPLLTKDDDPFYLFDNPTRKDHNFGVPHIAAASLKGLSLDAYQRAFPSSSGIEIEQKKQLLERRHGYRLQDAHAKRLFGIEDDGNQQEVSRIGRLHYSAVWFKQVQFLVMNPREPETGIGTIPIQFEAIAPNPKEKAILEVVYFNPYGVKESDEQTVREDLARWLAAVGTWWPVLGLGAKRLAGYGAIKIEKATLQAVEWSGMENTQTPQRNPVAQEQPPSPQKQSYYKDYLDNEDKPLSEEAFKAKLDGKLADKDKEIAKLKNPSKKEIKILVSQRKNLGKNERKKYKEVVEYFKAHTTTTPQTTEEVVVIEELQIYERQEQGEDSWIKLAKWIS